MNRMILKGKSREEIQYLINDRNGNSPCLNGMPLTAEELKIAEIKLAAHDGFCCGKLKTGDRVCFNG